VLRIILDRVDAVVEGHHARSCGPRPAGQVSIMIKALGSARHAIEEDAGYLVPGDVPADLIEYFAGGAMAIVGVHVPGHRHPGGMHPFEGSGESHVGLSARPAGQVEHDHADLSRALGEQGPLSRAHSRMEIGGHDQLRRDQCCAVRGELSHRLPSRGSVASGDSRMNDPV